ncbi:MAG: aminopeptidase P family protein [Deltaproteobacteria bacterium]|jgi:Xaa-Pro aminopeptidase|nr:aminopeptidase P family protein [Deltaproteobacteria bacterium]
MTTDHPPNGAPPDRLPPDAGPDPVPGRLARLRSLMEKDKVGALYITCPENRRYFSGFSPADPMLSESSGSLLILPGAQYLITDGRYTTVAGMEAPLFEVVPAGAGGPGENLAKLLPEGSDFFFEPRYLSVHSLRIIAKQLGSRVANCLGAPFDPSLLRSSKSPDEVALIARALEITEQSMAELWENVEPGWTEERAALFMDDGFRRRGAQGPAFETILASGPQAALPHAVPGPRVIGEGEMVVVDCGARYRGYASDITRTYVAGEPEEWQKNIYRAVREAQLLALEAVRPGAVCREVDAVARGHITKAGFGEFFTHSLGHGVGLAVHEAPSLNPRNEGLLLPGDVVTVEPGIYLPGRGGVRLEQLVLVTETGSRLLNRDEHFYDFG